MSMNRDVNQASFTKSVRPHWVLTLLEGIVLVVLGLFAIIISPTATLAVAILLGWLFLISGLVGLATTFWARPAPGFWWSLLSAVLAVVVAAILLGSPVSAVSLTYLLTGFFVIEGLATIMFALEHRRQLSGRWEWMIASGVVDLTLAAVVILGLPGTSAWAIGLLIGINMIFGGSALMAMAIHVRANDPASRQSK